MNDEQFERLEKLLAGIGGELSGIRMALEDAPRDDPEPNLECAAPDCDETFLALNRALKHAEDEHNAPPEAAEEMVNVSN